VYGRVATDVSEEQTASILYVDGGGMFLRKVGT
jgi:hypothetical protein